MPYVAETPMPFLLGRYRVGDNYILVNERLSGPLAYAVRVHEFVHYLQWKSGVWEFTKESSCAREAEAFAVGNKVLRRLGETKLMVDWNVMKAAYGC